MNVLVHHRLIIRDNCNSVLLYGLKKGWLANIFEEYSFDPLTS